MLKTTIVPLTASVPVLVAPNNGARRAITVENLHASDPVLVRAFKAPILSAADTDAKQTYSFSPAPAGGTYKIKLGSYTTTALAHNANAAAVQTALRLLPGYATVTVALSDGVFTVTSVDSVVPTPKLQIVESSLVTAGVQEVQLLTVEELAGSGTFRLERRRLLGKKEYVDITGPIAFDVTDAVLQARLRNFTSDYGLTVAEAGGVYTITYSERGPKELLTVIDNQVFTDDNEEIQALSFNGTPDSGTFKLAFGELVTDAITYDDTPATMATAIQTALRTLDGLEDVEVTTEEGEYFIEFVGVAGDVPMLTVVDNELEDDSQEPVGITIEEFFQGGVQPVNVTLIRDTAGVSITQSAASVAIEDEANRSEMAASIAGGERLTEETTGPFYALSETAVDLKVIEVF